MNVLSGCCFTAVRGQVEQHGMVDAGVVALQAAAEDEPVRRQPGADVAHGGFGSAFLLAGLVALDDALNALEGMDPRKARAVELRFFAG